MPIGRSSVEIGSMPLRYVCFCVVGVARAGLVLRWRVQREQPERLGTRVDEVVRDSGADESEVVWPHRGALAVDDRLAVSFDEDQHLVIILVDLEPDVLSGGDTHRDDLHHLAGQQHLAIEQPGADRRRRALERRLTSILSAQILVSALHKATAHQPC